MTFFFYILFLFVKEYDGMSLLVDFSCRIIHLGIFNLENMDVLREEMPP